MERGKKLKEIDENSSSDKIDRSNVRPSEIQPYAVDNSGNRWSIEGPIDPTSYFNDPTNELRLYKSIRNFEDAVMQLNRSGSDRRKLSDLYDDVTQANLDTVSFSEFSDVRSDDRRSEKSAKLNVCRSLSFTCMELSPYDQFEKETGMDFLKTIVEKSIPEKREDFKQKQVESNSSFGESSGYSSFSEFKSLPRSESERSKTQDCHNSPSFFLPWEPCNKIVRRRRLSLVRERRPRLCKIDLNVCAESEPKSSRPKILDETGRKNLLHSDTRIQILSDHENETSLESNSRMSRNSKVGPGPDGCQGSDARPTSQTSRDLNDLTGYQSQVTRDQEIDEGISEVPLSNDSRVPNDDEVFVFDSARTDILPRRTLELPSEGYGDYEQRKGSVLTHEECDLYWRRHIEVTVVVDNDPNNLEMRDFNNNGAGNGPDDNPGKKGNSGREGDANSLSDSDSTEVCHRLCCKSCQILGYVSLAVAILAAVSCYLLLKD